MKVLTNKHRNRLQAEGMDLLETMKEVYREANQVFAHDLLAALRRCRHFPGYPPVVLENEPPQCGCPDCTAVRTRMTTHLRSIAITRAALDAYAQKLIRVQRAGQAS